MDKAYYSDRGGRKVNEDYIAFQENSSFFCAILADGLGGQGNGDVASKTAVNTIIDECMQTRSAAPDDVSRYFNDANAAVLNINQGKHNTLTTAVALFGDKECLTYAHVGDSRLYYFYNGKIVERTIDHSVPQVAVMLGEIKEEDIRSHPDRNRILRAIGSVQELKTDIRSIGKLYPGSHAFLLCSDGFWEYVLESEMELEFSKSNNAKEWLSGMCSHRVLRAPADCDNNSAIVLIINA